MSTYYFTTSCSGCFESEDGHPVGEYPWDAKANCYIGGGCKECGYTGKRRIRFKIECTCDQYDYCEIHGMQP